MVLGFYNLSFYQAWFNLVATEPLIYYGFIFGGLLVMSLSTLLGLRLVDWPMELQKATESKEQTDSSSASTLRYRRWPLGLAAFSFLFLLIFPFFCSPSPARGENRLGEKDTPHQEQVVDSLDVSTPEDSNDIHPSHTPQHRNDSLLN
ncbi:MAG: hypothetical protein D6722_22600 [Bacteroidetes bacterium]|nr:MAG: hypothetical protein D6722_22600 [Bacteroidota bacterium]